MKLSFSICIDASPAKVWNYLSDVSNIHQWVESISTSFTHSSQTTGIGTIRVCQVGNRQFREKFTDWSEGNYYTYQALNPPAIMKRAMNTWSVTPENGKALLTSRPVIEFRAGIIGKFLGLLMQPLLKKQMIEALGAFKYLVENDKPYPGKPAQLPKGPVAC